MSEPNPPRIQEVKVAIARPFTAEELAQDDIHATIRRSRRLAEIYRQAADICIRGGGDFEESLRVNVQRHDDLVTLCETCEAQADDLNNCKQILTADITLPRSQPLPNPINPLKAQTVAFCLYDVIQELRVRRHQHETLRHERDDAINANRMLAEGVTDATVDAFMERQKTWQQRAKLAQALAELRGKTLKKYARQFGHLRECEIVIGNPDVKKPDRCTCDLGAALAGRPSSS